jgi:hypothetical protein
VVSEEMMTPKPSPSPAITKISSGESNIQEQRQLDHEGDQVRDQHRDRHRHAREIDLAEQVGVLHKGLTGLGQASRKVAPDHRPRHIEQELRQPICGQASDITEHDREGDRGQEWLDEIPERPEDRLLVDGHEVPSHEEHHQVAIMPELAQAQVQQPPLGLDH